MKSYELRHPPDKLAKAQDLLRDLCLHWESLPVDVRRDVVEGLTISFSRMLTEEV